MCFGAGSLPKQSGAHRLGLKNLTIANVCKRSDKLDALELCKFQRAGCGMLNLGALFTSLQLSETGSALCIRGQSVEGSLRVTAPHVGVC